MIEIYKTIQGSYSQFIEEAFTKVMTEGRIHSSFFGQIFYIEGYRIGAINILNIINHIFSTSLASLFDNSSARDDIGTKFLKVNEFSYGSWINIINPTEEEISKICSYTNLSQDFIKYALDEEEKPRIDSENDYALILVDIPVERAQKKEIELYNTIPLGILINQTNIITICLRDNLITKTFIEGKIKNFYTFKKTRFLFQILYRISTYYLQYLKTIDKLGDKVEQELHKSLKNKELIHLLGLEKSLVYFSTSLKANEIVLEKIQKFRFSQIKMYPDDMELLEDVNTEIKQAIEMASIYSNILTGTMDAYASIISNNLNIVMKVLTSITIILAVPTMISSFFGMNVPNPFDHMLNESAFGIIFVFSIIISTIIAIILVKKDMF